MATHAMTATFLGAEARPVEVQCALSPGLPAFNLVGLPAKAVSESRERVRAALVAAGVVLPAKRITINLAPADLPKEGSHFDLPVALALLAALDVVPADRVAGAFALGELSLDGALKAVAGVLPAALTAAGLGLELLCPAANGAEAAWVGAADVAAAPDLVALIEHLAGRRPLPPPEPDAAPGGDAPAPPDLADVRGQEAARRALEIAAAGRHHLLLCGPPGAGKSMLARRLPGIMPPLSAEEALESSVIHSVAGMLPAGGLVTRRPFRSPHHEATAPAILGGGRNAGPGELALAHNGVLFLDELPEFPRQVLEALRQPLESGEVHVARANARVSYPARLLLVAAANPCRCGYLGDPHKACRRAPGCGRDYLARISGPLLDRIDLRLTVRPVPIEELAGIRPGETSAEVAARVAAARGVQEARYAGQAGLRTNADADGELLRKVVGLSRSAERLLQEMARAHGLSARSYHRLLRVARTIADLAGSEAVGQDHVAEAAAYKLPALEAG